MGKVKVCASLRCFFPKAAFFKSTAQVAQLAKKVGYDGIEFFPTWRFVWEMNRHGELLAPKEMVASGHRDWRFDRVMFAKLESQPWWRYQLREKADFLFPLSAVCLRALKRFQEEYRLPVSVMWFEDTKNFSPVMLELWDKTQGIDQKGLLAWLEEDPGGRGVVIDTAKWTKWLKSNRLLDQDQEVLKELLPHLSEVHHRGVKRKDKWQLSQPEESNRILRTILKAGFKGRIVVELGWPDLDDPPFGLVREDVKEFEKIHRSAIKFIRSL